MSPRNLTTAFKNDTLLDNAEYVHLVMLSFSGGTTYINDGAQDILWNAVTWDAVGGALTIGNVEESTDSSGQGVELKLNGVDQTILAALLSNDYRGRVCRVYRARLNSSGAVIADPYLMFEGLQLSAFEVEENRDSQTGGTVTVSTRIKGRMGIDRQRGITSSVVGHQHYFPGDTFWQNAAPLTAQPIYWGNAGPQVPGGGGGGGGPPPDNPSRSS